MKPNLTIYRGTITVAQLRADRSLRPDIIGEIHPELRGVIHPELRGDLSWLCGEINPGLWGNLSGMRGVIHRELRGDLSWLRGEINPELRGDLSELRGEIHPELRGDLSGLWGNLSGLWGVIPAGACGNLDACELTDDERAAGVNIADLIASN